jgi:hypothetical protein
VPLPSSPRALPCLAMVSYLCSDERTPSSGSPSAPTPLRRRRSACTRTYTRGAESLSSPVQPIHTCAPLGPKFYLFWVGDSWPTHTAVARNVAALLSLRRHRGSRHGHAAAVPVHRHGPDASMRTHVPVPSRATTRAPAWRGQGQAFGSLSRLTSSAPHPSTGRGFATDGNPSSLEARAPT